MKIDTFIFDNYCHYSSMCPLCGHKYIHQGAKSEVSYNKHEDGGGGRNNLSFNGGGVVDGSGLLWSLLCPVSCYTTPTILGGTALLCPRPQASTERAET